MRIATDLRLRCGQNRKWQKTELHLPQGPSPFIAARIRKEVRAVNVELRHTNACLWGYEIQANEGNAKRRRPQGHARRNSHRLLRRIEIRKQKGKEK